MTNRRTSFAYSVLAGILGLAVLAALTALGGAAARWLGPAPTNVDPQSERATGTAR